MLHAMLKIAAATFNTVAAAAAAFRTAIAETTHQRLISQQK
jgi:hypothetical protein